MKVRMGLLVALVLMLGVIAAVFNYGQASSSSVSQETGLKNEPAAMPTLPPPGCHILDVAYSPAVGGTVHISPEPNCQGSWYTNGTVVTLMAVPKLYYAFLFWVVSPTPDSNPNTNYPMISFVMDGSYIANAFFGGIISPPGGCRALAYTANPLEWGGAVVDPLSNCGPGGYDLGTDVTLTAIPLDGKYFSYWEIIPDASPPITETTIAIILEMNDGYTAIANFSEDQPIGGLTAENDSPTMLGETTTLTATISSGTNVSYTWNFGDGQTGSGAQATHLYNDVGVYTVTVTAANTANTQVATTVVTVEELDKVFMPTVIGKP